MPRIQAVSFRRLLKKDLIRLFKSATVVSPCTPGSSTNTQSQALFLKKVHNVALSTCFSREGMT